MRRAADTHGGSYPLRACLCTLGFAIMAALLSPVRAAETVPEVYPVDLPTVLRLAGAQNLDVQLAMAALAEARANHLSVIERFFPSLTPAISLTRHDGNTQAADGTIIDVDKRSYTSGLTLAAQVTLGDAIFGALQSRQFVNAADLAVQSQQQDSLLAAVGDYFDLVRAEAQIGIVAEALATSTSYEQQLGEAVRLGIAFRGDELRVRTQTWRLQIDAQQAQEQQRVAAARLVRTLHLDPLVRLQAADRAPRPLRLADPESTVAALVAQALDRRIELARSSALRDAAEAARRGALYGPMIPTIGAQAFGGELGRDPGTAGSSRDYYLGLSWRIGPGGLFDFGRMRAADARLTSAEINEQKLRDEIARQVIEARARVDATHEQVSLAEQALESAAETLRLTRERKQLGVGTVLEDIQAQQELAHARTQYVSSVTDWNKAQYVLRRTLGDPLTTAAN